MFTGAIAGYYSDIVVGGESAGTGCMPGDEGKKGEEIKLKLQVNRLVATHVTRATAEAHLTFFGNSSFEELHTPHRNLDFENNCPLNPMSVPMHDVYNKHN